MILDIKCMVPFFFQTRVAQMHPIMIPPEVRIIAKMRLQVFQLRGNK